MPNETIELAKNWDPAKMKWPVVFQEKLDGVPVKFTMQDNGKVVQHTRQGEEINSCDHIAFMLKPVLHPGEFIVAEMYDKDLPFKTISGLVRQQQKVAGQLQAYVFDTYVLGHTDYIHRLSNFWINFKRVHAHQRLVLPMPHQTICCNEQEVNARVKQLPTGTEGACVHHAYKKWEPGKRNWLFQRIKPAPTIDLRVVGFEEAIDKYGDPKGMVGRINVSYKGKVIGIGPGALTHDERIALWEQYIRTRNAPDALAEIKYMSDPTYDALRQPTFVRWRPDKEIPDA